MLAELRQMEGQPLPDLLVSEALHKKSIHHRDADG
jgi:hypothetical protein